VGTAPGNLPGSRLTGPTPVQLSVCLEVRSVSAGAAAAAARALPYRQSAARRDRRESARERLARVMRRGPWRSPTRPCMRRPRRVTSPASPSLPVSAIKRRYAFRARSVRARKPRQAGQALPPAARSARSPAGPADAHAAAVLAVLTRSVPHRELPCAPEHRRGSRCCDPYDLGSLGASNTRANHPSVTADWYGAQLHPAAIVANTGDHVAPNTTLGRHPGTNSPRRRPRPLFAGHSRPGRRRW